MRIFYKIINRRRAIVALYILMGLTASLLSAFSTHYFQKLLDDFNARTLTAATIIIYSLLIISLCIINYLDNYQDTKLQHFIYLYLKLLALKKMSTINYLYYQKLGIGKLIQQIENGAAAGKNILYGFYFRLFRELIPNVIISLAFIGFISFRIMLIVVAGYVVVFFITNIILKYLYDVKKHILINEELLNKHIVRGLMELVVFRVNKRYFSEINRSEKASDEIINSKTKMVMIHEMFFTVFAMLIIIIKIAIIIYSFMKSVLSVGEIVALITFLDNAYQPIAVFNVLFVQYKLDRVALNRYIDILEFPDDKNLSSGDNVSIAKGGISFYNVCFSYESKQILKNISFNIVPGSAIAFVGESGSGKSTIIKQIVGLIKPDEGRIAIDNIDLSNMNLQYYYNYISYTSQESPVFDGTLKENIVFDKSVEEEKIIEALKLAGLHKFYESLPHGLNTQIGERGIMMSGGERQRLALTRIFFQQARIIILDEATSAMDNITEECVMKNVMTFLKGRTVIIIAHRLNSIRNVDNIFVMKQGEIIGSGRFDGLLKSNDYFKELWEVSNS